MIDWNKDGKISWQDDSFFHGVVLPNSQQSSTAHESETEEESSEEND